MIQHPCPTCATNALGVVRAWLEKAQALLMAGVQQRRVNPAMLTELQGLAQVAYSGQFRRFMDLGAKFAKASQSAGIAVESIRVPTEQDLSLNPVGGTAEDAEGFKAQQMACMLCGWGPKWVAVTHAKLCPFCKTQFQAKESMRQPRTPCPSCGDELDGASLEPGADAQGNLAFRRLCTNCKWNGFTLVYQDHQCPACQKTWRETVAAQPLHAISINPRTGPTSTVPAAKTGGLAPWGEDEAAVAPEEMWRTQERF